MADRRGKRARGTVPGQEIPIDDPRDALLSEAPATVLDDEEEVHDLGFIVENHDEAHARHLERWQRLETLDTDEPLETDPTGPLPAEARALERLGVPRDAHEVDFRVGGLAAERDEQEFAEANQLVADPYDEGLTTVLGDEDDVAADLDHDRRADRVNLLGRARGITTGFGSTLAQDIGPDGFSIRDNPLAVPADARDHPISTDILSDEAAGLRDVDEMGSEEELDRLADQGAALEEGAQRPRRRRTKPTQP